MKTKQHSTDPKKVSKASKRKELDNEITLSMSEKRLWPISQERLTNLGKDLLLMFEEDKKMVTVLPWRQKHDLTYFDVNYYSKKCPELKKMINEFKDRAGWRIFEKGLYRECDGNMAARGMTMYSRDYRKAEVWRNNLKKELAKEAGGKIIEVKIPTFNTTGLVPEKESR